MRQRRNAGIDARHGVRGNVAALRQNFGREGSRQLRVPVGTFAACFRLIAASQVFLFKDASIEIFY